MMETFEQAVHAFGMQLGVGDLRFSHRGVVALTFANGCRFDIEPIEKGVSLHLQVPCALPTFQQKITALQLANYRYHPEQMLVVAKLSRQDAFIFQYRLDADDISPEKLLKVLNELQQYARQLGLTC